MYKWLSARIQQLIQLVKNVNLSLPVSDRRWSKELETDRERRAYFLRVLNRGWLIVGFLASVSLFYYPEERATLTIIAGFTFAIYFIVRFFNNTQKTVFAGFIFTSLVNTTFFFTFLLLTIQHGFVQAFAEHQYILMLMGLSIIFAGAFIHRMATFSLAALNSTLMLYITQVLAPEVGPVFSVHVFWWLIATSIWLYETSLSNAFTRLQQARTNLEDQVDARTKFLQVTVSKLEQTQESLKAKNEELEAFSYSVSHDLRAPLRAIDGYSTILSEDYNANLDEEGLHILTRMQENTRKMDTMIQGMLYLSRLDRHKMLWQKINVEKMAREVFEEVHRENPDQPVEFDIDPLPPFRADASLLRQVFTNLLSNALKFSRTRNPAIINISCNDHHNGTAIYQIRDNGVGFDMCQVHRLFAPFQRLHHSDEFEGNGIGLSIVSRILQRHSGRIWVESEVDKGTTFYFTIGEPAEDDELIIVEPDP